MDCRGISQNIKLDEKHLSSIWEVFTAFKTKTREEERFRFITANQGETKTRVN